MECLSALLTICITLLAAAALRLLAIRLHQSYFSPGFTGDSSTHYVIYRTLKRNPKAERIDQFVIGDGPMSYPTPFHHYCRVFSEKVVARNQWLPNAVLWIVACAMYLGLCLVWTAALELSPTILLPAAALALLMSPTTMLFDGDNASYLKLSERFMAQASSGLGYATLAGGLVSDNAWLFLLAVPPWCLSLLAAKFSRQVSLFVLPCLSLLALDWRPALVMLASWALALAFGRGRLVASLRDMWRHLQIYRTSYVHSPILKTRFAILRHPREIFTLNSTWRDWMRRVLEFEPYRFLTRYPEIWLSLAATAHAPEDKRWTAQAILLAPVAVYLVTSTQRFKFVGEGYRYLDYTARWTGPLLLGWLVAQAGDWGGLWLFAMATPTLAIWGLVLAQQWHEAPHPDLLTQFLNKLPIQDRAVVFGITTRIADDVAARRPKWAVYRWQPGRVDTLHEYMETYPFPKRDWWPLFERHGATHVIVAKGALRHADFNYPFDELERLHEDQHYAAFVIPDRRANKTKYFETANRLVIFAPATSPTGVAIISGFLYECRRRYKNVAIFLACPERAVDTYMGCPHLTGIVSFESPSLVEQLTSAKPDMIVDLNVQLDPVADRLASSLPADARLGFALPDHSRSNASVWTRLVETPKEFQNSLAALLAAMGIPATSFRPRPWGQPAP